VKRGDVSHELEDRGWTGSLVCTIFLLLLLHLRSVSLSVSKDQGAKQFQLYVDIMVSLMHAISSPEYRSTGDIT